MKVKITKDTMADGKPVTKGQEIEISEAEAESLIDQKKAKEIGEGDVEIVEDPEPETPVEGKKKGK